MVRINLLPTKVARKKETVVLQLIVGVIVIALAVVGCMFKNHIEDQKIEAEQATIKDLELKISQLQAVIAKVDDFKKKKADLNRKIDTIKDLNAKRSGPVKLMEEFTYVVPRKIYITTYREADKQLSLEGVAADGPTVADFIDNLRGSKYFYDVQLIQVQQVLEENQKKQKFSINCRVNYVPSGKV